MHVWCKARRAARAALSHIYYLLILLYVYLLRSESGILRFHDTSIHFYIIALIINYHVVDIIIEVNSLSLRIAIPVAVFTVIAHPGMR